jgi:hypothetical protein
LHAAGKGFHGVFATPGQSRGIERLRHPLAQIRAAQSLQFAENAQILLGADTSLLS